ncbi:MAG: bifunctional hydroxymethylpyrimidine kinase/phosphomethylpyrimidine kinase [Desulfobacterales bacterium]|nr:bifunctional hydroxymethylpyrimidine kinase/phosphomethylpyrimidine kinase [Desulfobacterales bacterium]
MDNQNYCTVLTIAGSDSSGGAGIQADLKTVSALGCYGMSVITALTAQNTTGVSLIHAVPLSMIEAQLDAIYSDIHVDAVKIGMLHSAEVIQVIAKQLQHYHASCIVLDPVMVAQTGSKLLQDDAIEALKEVLLPIADIVTPNLPEASVLYGKKIQGLQEMYSAAKNIAGFGCKNVLIKGGHDSGSESADVLYIASDDQWMTFSKPRIISNNTHGTGCTLSSAIAAGLAKEQPLIDAVYHAKTYVYEAICAGAGYKLGHGFGPVHHFYHYWKTETK